KADGIVDWTQSARQVADRVRGVDPWPSAETTRPVSGGRERIKLFGPTVVSVPADAAQPGEVLGVGEHGLIVACGQGACAMAALQAPGRRRTPARDFIGGRPMPPGTVLGPDPAAAAGDGAAE
ncbi:MAG: hypothetical protein AAGC55_13460, partial [Myxococcota bacterium]